MNEITRGQIVQSAAEVYDEFFLPALFQEWAARVADAAQIGPGQRVLDVACGTGVLALEAAGRAGPNGDVTGLDINEGMLSVARSKSGSVEWRSGRAESLPYPDEHFDAVVSQFGLMFFEDRRAAINEMARVLKPGRRLAVAVWDTLDNTPGYAVVTAMLERLFGDQVAETLRSPYVLGDEDKLKAIFDIPSLQDVRVNTCPGTARFPSIQAWMYTDVKGWTLADVLEDAQFELLQKEAQRELRQFVTVDGSVAFPSPAHIVTASAV